MRVAARRPPVRADCVETTNGLCAGPALYFNDAELPVSPPQEVFGMTFREQVEAALPAVRAGSAAHGVHLRLVNATDDGIVEVQMRGKSVACPMSQRMFAKGILHKLQREIPLITDVVCIDAP